MIKKVFIYLLFLLFISTPCVNSAPRIVADLEPNNMVTFYVWDNWNWTTSKVTSEGAVVKLVDEHDQRSYWFRIDAFTLGRFLPEGTLQVGDRAFKVSQIENLNRIHLNSALSERGFPSLASIHDYFDISEEALLAIKNAKVSEKIILYLPMQSEKVVKLPITGNFLESVRALVETKYEDKDKYLRKKR